jgi:PAS domain S-box-containing protein
VRILTHRRALQYLGLLLLLLLLSIVIPYTGLGSDALFIAVAGTLSANLAMLVGLVALIYYSGTKNPLYVFTGAGFLGAALLDSFQVITVVGLAAGAPWGNAAAESGSRWFLPLWLWLGVWVSSRGRGLGRLTQGAAPAICLAGAGLTLLCLLWVRAMPAAVASGGIVGNVAVAVLFFGAIEALLRRRNWPYDVFEHCLMLSLIVGFLLNTLFLGGSREPHEGLFAAAQHLKNLSYLLALAGLVMAMRQSLQQAEENAGALAEVNETLRREVDEHQRVRQQFQELAVSLEQRVEERTKESAEAQQAAERAKEEAEQARRVEQQANRQLRAEMEERLAVEQALRESESRLQLALSAGQIGIWTWEIADGRAFWDEQVYDIFGQTPRDLAPSYNNALTLIHPEDVEGVRQAIGQAAEQGTELDIAYRVIWPDKSVRHVMSRAMAVRDDTGKTTRMIGTVVDVSEYKRGEQQLRQREMELSQMVKVLSCLHEIARLLEQAETPLEQIFERTIELLPRSWHDPQNTFARLQTGGREYHSGIWRDTAFQQCAEILVGGEAIGGLEIGFANLEPERERFRHEEIKVTQIVAASLGRTVEFKRATENLRRSERRYRGLFDHMISGCALHEIIVDETGKPADYRFLEINPAFENLVGLRAGEALGKTVREVLPCVEQQWIETYGNVALGGKPVRSEHYIQQLGRYIEVAAFSPEKGRCALIFNDITDRRQAEVQRAAEQNLLRTLIDNVPDSIYVKDTARRYLITNKANLKRLRLAEETQARGKTVFDFFPEEHAALYDSDDCAVLASRTPILDREEPYRDADGDLRYFSTTKVPLFGAKDEVIGLVGISRDITERKRAEEALRLSQFSLDHAADAVFWVGPDARLVYVNEAACTSLGYRRERLLSMTVGDFDENARQRWNEIWGEVKQAGALTVESSHLTATGERIPVEVNVNYLNFDGSEYHCAFVRDITARKRAAEALERKARELAASNAELEQFAYAASHDLQEPLRMIASYAQLLARRYRGKLDGDADEFIRFIVEGAERMQTLIRDLLAYSRAGRASQTPARVDLQDCAQVSLANLRAMLEESAAAVEIRPLPELVGQRSQLIQLFQNLIGNALKYHGADPPRVHVSAERRGSEWLFSVRDNGIGIDPQYREQVFDLFRRLHSRNEYAGTGIGLAICKKIVESHGGRIWVESEPGCGATFHFTLPAETSTAAPALQSADSATRVEGAAPPDAR